MRSTPERIAVPADTADVAAALKSAVQDGLRVKAVGSGHSFSEIAAADGVQVRLDRLDRLLDVDPAAGRVTVGAGIPLHRLTPLLDEHGLAMENLGDIDRQTLAGATSTGTHGTGGRFGGIATQIRGLEIVLADGSVVTTSADERPELLELARVGLGALGVITAVTVQCVPRFALHVVDEPMPLDRVLDEVDDLVATNDHFEFFWFPYTETALTRRFQRVPADAELHPEGRLAHWFDEAVVTNVGWDALLRVATRRPGSCPGSTGSSPVPSAGASTPTCRTGCSRLDAMCGSTRVSMRSRASTSATCSASSVLSWADSSTQWPSRSSAGSSRPTTSRWLRRTVDPARTSPSTSTARCRTSRSSMRPRTSSRRSRAGRTGARCTAWAPPS